MEDFARHWAWNTALTTQVSKHTLVLMMHSLRLSPFVAKLRNGILLFGSKPCFEEGFDRIQNDSVFSRMAKTTCAKSFARLAMEFASGPATVHLSVKLSAPFFFNAGLEYAMQK